MRRRRLRMPGTHLIGWALNVPIIGRQLLAEEDVAQCLEFDPRKEIVYAMIHVERKAAGIIVNSCIGNKIFNRLAGIATYRNG